MTPAPLQIVHLSVTHRRHEFGVVFDGCYIGHVIDLPTGVYDFYEHAWAAAYLAAVAA